MGANLTAEKYHNLGIGMDTETPDVGRYAVTKDKKDFGAFKPPTIRKVTVSAPYMHDGSLQRLEQVVEHYIGGGTPNPGIKSSKSTSSARGIWWPSWTPAPVSFPKSNTAGCRASTLAFRGAKDDTGRVTIYRMRTRPRPLPPGGSSSRNHLTV